MRLVRVPAVLLTGPPGSGKSTVLDELSDALDASGVSHAAIDADGFDRLLPGEPARDLLYENVAAVWSNYRRWGAERLLLASTVESPADIALWRQALSDCDFTVVRLRAEAVTLRRRITERGETEHLREKLCLKAEHLAGRLESLGMPGHVVDTEHEQADEVAAAVLDLLGWQ